MDKIETRAIIEMLGAPKEHIVKTLKEYIEKLQEEGKKINHISYAEPIEQGKFFSVFSEIEIDFNNMDEVLSFCFDSMPSSIEILSPEKLSFDANILTGFLNDLQAKIHQTDALIKDTSVQKQLLDTNAINILHNFVYYILKEGEKTPEELSKFVGIEPKEIKAFLDVMIKKGLIKEDAGKYSITSQT